MIRRLFFIACGIVCIVAPAQALQIEPGDVGPIYQFQKARSSFTLVNDSDSELRAIEIKSLRPNDRVLSAPKSVPARGNAVVDVEIDSENDFGARGHSFKVWSDGAKDPRLARISLYAMSVLDEPQRVLDFGTVTAGESPTITYSLVTDDPSIRVAAIKEAPDFAEVTIAKDGRSLLIRHRDKTAWGKLAGLLKMRLESAPQTEAWLQVHSEVRGDVVPSATTFQLGVARVGQENEYILQYRSDSKPFTLDKAALEGIVGTTSIEKCAGGDKFCQQVRLKIDGNQPNGQINGILRAHVAEYDRDIVVLTGGLLLDKKIKIKSLDEEMAAQAKMPQTPPSPTLGDALKSMSVVQKPVEAVVPPGNGPLLRWSVDNETLIYGYAIYRADSENGVFRRHGDFVRRSAVSKPGIVSNYAFRDTQGTVGREYWYRIAAFQNDGKREFLTQPQRATVRSPDTGSAAR